MPTITPHLHPSLLMLLLASHLTQCTKMTGEYPRAKKTKEKINERLRIMFSGVFVKANDKIGNSTESGAVCDLWDHICCIYFCWCRVHEKMKYCGFFT